MSDRNRRRGDEYDGESLATIIVRIYEEQEGQALQLGLIQRQLEELLRAFPEGDLYGHKLYHAELIRKEREKRLAWQNIRSKTLVGLLLLALTGLGHWIVTHIRDIVGVLKP